MNTPENERIIQLLASDLESQSPTTRIAAIMHLKHLAPLSKLQEILEAHLKNEKNDECRLIIRQIIEKSDETRQIDPDEPISPEALPDNSDKILDLFLKTNTEKLKGFFPKIRSLPNPILADFMLRLFTRETRVEVLKELILQLKQEPAVFKPDQLLQTLLSEKSWVPILRIFPIILDIEPDSALPKLPRLLSHRSIAVRIYAVRVLYRLFPGEAIRLLSELVRNDCEDLRAIGLGLLVTFPFNETGKLLVDAIEESLIPEKSVPLLIEIIRNNPDSDFLENLSWIYARQGENARYVKDFMKVAAESISFVGIKPGTPGQIMGQAIQRAREKITRSVNFPIFTEQFDSAIFQPPEESQKAQSTEVVPSQKKRSETNFVEHEEKRTTEPVKDEKEEKQHQESFTKDISTDDLITRLPENPDENFMIFLNSWLNNNCRHNRDLIKWLSNLLENSTVKVTLLSMELLSTYFPRALIPHLPVLCFHQNPMIVNQALRHYRKLDETSLLRRIQSWIDDGKNPMARHAALTALVQMKFSQAKHLVFKALEKIYDPELIENFGNVLLINPERDTAVKLKKLARQSTPDRGRIFATLAQNVDLNLKSYVQSSQKGILGSFLSAAQLETLFDEISQINFLSGDFIQSSLEKNSPMVTIAGGIILIIGSMLLLSRLVSTSPATTRTQRTSPVRERPVGIVANKFGEDYREGTLLDFDGSNHLWLFRTSDNSVYQVMIPVKHRVQKHDRLKIKVTPTGKAIRGMPVYAATEILIP